MKAESIIFFFIFHFSIIIFVLSHDHNHKSDEVINIQNLGEHFEKLDKDGKFNVHWSIEEEEGSVTFDIIAKTTGFVGFGLTLDGSLKESDIFLGGLRNSGPTHTQSAFFGDYHGSASGQLVLDSTSNWGLIDAQENSTHTYMKVTRLLNTCDPQDIPIHEEGTNRMFWILGKDDWDFKSWEDHGTKFTNIFPLPMPNVDLNSYKVWDITAEGNFPVRVSAHWCVIREGPKSVEDIMITGYEPILSSEDAASGSLHITLQICIVPPGVSLEELFGPYKDGSGADCHNNNGTLPNQYCHTGVVSRLVGAKRVLLPEHVGITFPKNSYYSLELHYKNPNQVWFKAGLRFYYTDKPRKYVAHRVVVSTNPIKQAIMLPPNQKKFTIVSHFPSQCIGDGFKIFNLLLHSHGAGRSLRLRHFRNGQELPTILYDENYSNLYQQNRHLKEEREVLPGKEAVFYEMCVSHMYSYSEKGLKALLAASWVDVDKQMKLLGITNYNTTSDGEHMTTYVYEPKELSGELGHVLEHHIQWTPKLLSDLQDLYLYGTNHLTCTSGKDLPIEPKDTVKLPLTAIIHPYKRPDVCSSKHQYFSSKMTDQTENMIM